jgi:hypothetical protein
MIEFDHQLPVGLRRLAADPQKVDRERIHTVVRTPNEMTTATTCSGGITSGIRIPTAIEAEV